MSTPSQCRHPHRRSSGGAFAPGRRIGRCCRAGLSQRAEGLEESRQLVATAQEAVSGSRPTRTASARRRPGASYTYAGEAATTTPEPTIVPREHEVRAERQDAVPRRNRPRRPELPRIDGSRKRSRLKARRTESQPRPEPEPRRDSDERPRCGASFGPRRSRPPALTTPAQALAAPDST